jgi:large subunit ribosomal protein L7A
MLDRLVGEKVIGIKQCVKALKSGKGQVLYVAKDVENKLIAPLIDLANNSNVKIESIDTMIELGKICEIEVKASAALIL